MVPFFSLWCLFMTLSTAQDSSPTKAPTSIDEEQVPSNLYGPERFTRLDWILSGCILFILCHICIFCCIVIHKKVKNKQPKSAIALSSGINHSNMKQKNIKHRRVNSSLDGPTVTKPFAANVPHTKQDTMAFDAAVAGIALTKPTMKLSLEEDDMQQDKYIEVEVEAEEQPLARIMIQQQAQVEEYEYEDDEYEEYETYDKNQANAKGYSPIIEAAADPYEPELIQIDEPKAKPPKPVTLKKKEVVIQPQKDMKPPKFNAPPKVPSDIKKKASTSKKKKPMKPPKFTGAPIVPSASKKKEVSQAVQPPKFTAPSKVTTAAKKKEAAIKPVKPPTFKKKQVVIQPTKPPKVPAANKKKEVIQADVKQPKVTAPPKVPTAILKELNAEAQDNESVNKTDKTEESVVFVSIEEAKSGKGVNREKLLSDDDFFTVFGMKKDAFYKLPAWKQKKAKKSKGLF